MLLLLALACAHPLSVAPNLDTQDWPDWPEADQAVLREMQRRDLVAVSACVAQDGVLLWCQGYGWADVEAGVPAGPETPFLLASMTKPITTAGVLLAQEQGAVSVDHALSLSLDTPWSQAPTYGELLTHTASLQDDLASLQAVTSETEEPDLAGWLALELARADLQSEAARGSSWSYSNTGISLAALGVEEATGLGFEDFLAAALFGPLSLGFSSDPLAFEVTPAQRTLERDFQPQAHVRSSAWPAGFLYGTAGDYARFLGAVSGGLDGGFDGQPMLEQATPATDFGFLPYEVQGLGFQRFLDVGGREVWGHEGGYYGANTLGLVEPETGLAVVVLSTGGPPAGYRAWKSLTRIAEVLFEQGERSAFR